MTCVAFSNAAFSTSMWSAKRRMQKTEYLVIFLSNNCLVRNTMWDSCVDSVVTLPENIAELNLHLHNLWTTSEPCDEWTSQFSFGKLGVIIVTTYFIDWTASSFLKVLCFPERRLSKIKPFACSCSFKFYIPVTLRQWTCLEHFGSY